MMHRLQFLSKRPRILSCPNFLSERECDKMIELGKKRLVRFPGTSNSAIPPFEIDEDRLLDDKDRGLLLSIENRVATITGTRMHDDELGLQLQYTQQEDFDKGRFSLGLHVDTNNRFFRFATALVYLNTLPEDHDGQTVFPLVGLPPSSSEVEASSYLLSNKITHSNVDPYQKGAFAAAQQLTKLGFDRKHGLSIRPEKGKLILFFTRDEDGNVDPCTWHGGAAVLGTGKWTLQKFKEVPKVFRRKETDFRAFIQSKHQIVAASTGSQTYVVQDK